MKNQKGISLVALIITIIVMVILAGIVIVSAVADGGVIDRAQAAIKENERAEVQDLIIASYVYGKVASSEKVYDELNLELTADAIYENLTTNGFTLTGKDGSTAKSGSDIYVSENDPINLDIQGKHGNYTGTVTDKGLEDDLVIVEDDKIEEFAGGTYIGNSTTIIVTDDYKITAYASGTLLFENLQAEEISQPDDMEIPEECSKFFRINASGNLITAAISTDFSTLYTNDGGVFYLLYDEPIVNSATTTDSSIHWIQRTEKSGVVVVTYGESVWAYNTIVDECNNLEDISAYSNAEIISNDYEYSLVAHNSMNQDLVYCPNINKWIIIYNTVESSDRTILKAQIKSDYILELNTTMTQEEINSYIDVATD